MNTLGVFLSASCLVVSLLELRMRSDVAGRRMAAILAAAAWATMGLVALDQSRQCQSLQEKRTEHSQTVSATQISTSPLREEWTFKGSDGSVIEFHAGKNSAAQFVGTNPWHAKPSERW